jgi:hypothetical protein
LRHMGIVWRARTSLGSFAMLHLWPPNTCYTFSLT